jgi:hypothetical protein
MRKYIGIEKCVKGSHRQYVKKNMAVSDVGVACHRKMKRVGQKILGSFTVCHKNPSCDFDEVINRAVLDTPFESPRGA